MLEFYVNYTVASDTALKRVQVGPYANVVAATRQRACIENGPGVSHCWVGISRDETKQLLAAESQKVMPFIVPTATAA